MAYFEHIAQLPNNQVKCTLCNDIIHNSDRLLEAHLHDRKHKELYMKSLMTTNNIIMSTTDLYCYICNERITLSELISHVQSSNHQTHYSSIKDLVTLDGGLIFLPDKNSRHPFAFCLMCNKDVEFMYEYVKRHIHSDVHRRAKAMVLQPLNGIFSVKDNDQYLWCKMCRKFFDNYIEVIFQHVYETEHAKEMTKILRLINGHNIDLDRYLQDLREDKAWCNSCKSEVACNVTNLQSHISGKKHKNALINTPK